MRMTPSRLFILSAVIILVAVMFPGLHAYYPSARNSSRALRVVIDAIRQH